LKILPILALHEVAGIVNDVWTCRRVGFAWDQVGRSFCSAVTGEEVATNAERYRCFLIIRTLVLFNHKKFVELYDIGGETFTGQLLNNFQIRSPHSWGRQNKGELRMSTDA
jgi:hypothetical protein